MWDQQEMKGYLIIIILLLLSQVDDKRAARSIREGNQFYREGNMNEALNFYNQAINSKYRSIALINKGNALYRQKKYNAAVDAYLAVGSAENSSAGERSEAFYNLGVAYCQENNLEAGVEAYKNSLRYNWQNQEARENLQKALLEWNKSNSGAAQNQPKDRPQATPAIKVQKELEKLEQKEKKTFQDVNNKKSQYGGTVGKDW